MALLSITRQPLVLSAILCLSLQACTSLMPNSGRSVYLDKCAACHGVAGKGNGYLAASLESAPPDLTQIAARRDGVWPALEIMGIVDGYSKRYFPYSDMPIYDEFLEGNLVTFDTGNGIQTQIPAGLLAISNYLETIQKPAPSRFVP